MVQLLLVSLWVPCSFLSQTTNIYSVRTGELECLFVCLLVCDELGCVQASLNSHPGAAGKDFWREKAVEDGWMDRNIDVEICCNYTWYLFFILLLLNSKQTPKFRENRMCCIGQAKIQIWLSCHGYFFHKNMVLFFLKIKINCSFIYSKVFINLVLIMCFCVNVNYAKKAVTVGKESALSCHTNTLGLNHEHTPRRSTNKALLQFLWLDDDS